MRKTPILVLMLAVVLGGASVYLARDWLQRQTPQLESGAQPTGPVMELTTVVVARQPLKFGDSLNKEYVREVEWPANVVPQGSFRQVEDLFKSEDGQRLDKRVVLRSIQINEPILESKISGADGRATLSTILGEDKRAVTIRVNDVNGVAGFVLPGDRVDILLTRKEKNKEPITDVLLQHVKVLGIDQKASEDHDTPTVARAATFEVTQFQAQKLALAATVGTLSLALRNESDNQEKQSRTVRLTDLKSNVGDGDIVETVNAMPAEQEAGTGEAAKKDATKRVVRRVSPYTKVTVMRGFDASTQNVLKDKTQDTSGTVEVNGMPTSSNATKPSDDGAPATGGPRILVPQS